MAVGCRPSSMWARSRLRSVILWGRADRTSYAQTQFQQSRRSFSGIQRGGHADRNNRPAVLRQTGVKILAGLRCREVRPRCVDPTQQGEPCLPASITGQCFDLFEQRSIQFHYFSPFCFNVASKCLMRLWSSYHFRSSSLQLRCGPESVLAGRLEIPVLAKRAGSFCRRSFDSDVGQILCPVCLYEEIDHIRFHVLPPLPCHLQCRWGGSGRRPSGRFGYRSRRYRSIKSCCHAVAS